MPTVNFYLKQSDTNGKSLIYLKMKYGGKAGKVFVFTFGQNVESKNWNNSKQRVKSNKQTTADGKHSLNDLLDNLATICFKAYNEALKDGLPAPETLKRPLLEFLNQNNGVVDKEGFFKLSDRFINGEITHKGRKKSAHTLRNYKSFVNHLKDFEVKSRYPVSFESITLDFFYKYTSFLTDIRKLAPNTIATDISILKVMMGEAVDLGLTNNIQFKHSKFSYSEVETDQVYLTEAELHKLYKFKLESTKLEQARDLFIFGAWVGLRYSDYSNIKPENIELIDGDYFIRLITQKTKEKVIIPCHPVVLEIFKKYSQNANMLPRTLSIQKFNEYIKEVCKAAGMNEPGRLSTKPEVMLWEAVTSHTARRSFATNYYLQGFPTIDLMRITGHKSEKNFLLYLRISKLETAKRLSKHIKKNWSEMMMKVA